MISEMKLEDGVVCVFFSGTITPTDVRESFDFLVKEASKRPGSDTLFDVTRVSKIETMARKAVGECLVTHRAALLKNVGKMGVGCPAILYPFVLAAIRSAELLTGEMPFKIKSFPSTQKAMAYLCGDKTVSAMPTRDLGANSSGPILDASGISERMSELKKKLKASSENLRKIQQENTGNG